MGQALLAMIENIQREDMNCFETAEAIRHLIDTYHLTQEEAALRLGYSQSAIANKLRLLRLSAEEREIIVTAGLTERHARALIRLQREEQRVRVLNQMVNGNLTVAQGEALVEKLLSEAPPRHQRMVPLIRDVRVFFNTVNKAVEKMRDSGIAAKVERRETEQYTECVIRVPK
jgi:ParB family chromosome partitioning protein